MLMIQRRRDRSERSKSVNQGGHRLTMEDTMKKSLKICSRKLPNRAAVIGLRMAVPLRWLAAGRRRAELRLFCRT
jgi:hypothetical protein